MIIYDANVLLNLYRYPQTVSDDMLAVIEKLADAAWLPFHFALELHRNRPKVIAEQIQKVITAKRYVKESVDNLAAKIGELDLEKRHVHVNPDDILKHFRDAEKAV